MIHRRSTSVLATLGGVELIALTALAWGPWSTFPLPGLVIVSLAVAAYAAAGWWCTVGQNRPTPEVVPQSSDTRALALVWTVAILARLLLLPLTPTLSDDVYRYLWDGWVQSQGFNPFQYAPDDPALSAIRPAWHHLINHPHVPTIYPPVSQWAFRAAQTLGGTIFVLKSLWVVIDLVAGYVLARVAQATGRRVLPVVLWYLWSPLLIVEVAWSGHFEPLGLLMIGLVLWVSSVGSGGSTEASMTAATRGTTHRAKTMSLGVLLGLATLTKFAPAAALPALWRRYGWVPVMAFAAVCLGLYVPFLDVGVEQVTAGLRTYSEHWTANDGLFWILRSVIQDPLVARFLAAGVVGGVVVLTVARRMTVDDALLWTLGAGILLSPTVHPWYTLWLLPFAALRTHPAFLTLTATAFLGYWGLTEFQETGAWPLPWGARLMMWGPVWSLLLWGAWQGRRRNRAGEAKEP